MSYSETMEKLLEAVDLVVSQKLNNISFDKTIVCKIIDDSSKKDGYYIAEYENMKMAVYPTRESEDYIVGRDVYILVPQGNFSLKKIILGTVKTSELPVYMYTNPMKHLVKLSNNLYNNGLINNSEPIILRDFSTEGDMPAIKYLAFAADFTTSGTRKDYSKIYGIHISGTGVLKSTGEEDPNINWVFKSTDFQGNPYEFNGKFRQEQLFNIEDYSSLTLEISMFDSDEKNEDDFTFDITNVEMYYGYEKDDLTEIENYDKIIIYNKASEKDTYPNTLIEDELKFTIKSKRITQADGEIIINSEPTGDFKWFVYYTGSKDVGNGKNWACIEGENRNSLELSQDKTFKLIFDPESKSRIETKLPNINTQKALQITAKLNNTLTSNNLVFLRSDYDELQEALKGSGIELTSTISSFIYNGDSQEIISQTKKGNITANLSGAAVWKAGIVTYWHIPLNGTMFESPFIIEKKDGTDIYYWSKLFFGNEITKINNAKLIIEGENTKYQCDGQYVTNDGNYAIVKLITENNNAPFIPFIIKEMYSPGNTNNVIKCIVEYPEVEIGDVYDSINIGFDPRGTQGTAYTLSIVFDSQPYIEVYSGGTVTKQCTLKAVLKDPEGLDITSQIGQSGTLFADATIKWAIESQSIASRTIEFLTSQNNNNTLSYEVNFNSSQLENLSSYNGIISLELENVAQNNGLDINYKVFKAIPINYYTNPTELKITNITLPNEIKYKYDGTNPLYNKDPIVVNGYENISVEMKSNDDKNNYISLNTITNSIVVTAIAPTTFPKITLIVNVDGDKWYQPLAFYRNQYTSSILNTWDGTFEIDEKDGGKIFSKMIGAGVKNTDNSFSGVFMGAVGTETNNDATTGLYGYQEGKLRFKFTEKGDAYIGTGSDNHINFTDGDLDIAAKKFALNTDNIYIGDQPKEINGPIVQFGEGFRLYSDGTLKLNSGTKTNISLSIRYAGSQKISTQPDTLENWEISKENLITDNDKDNGMETWEDKYLYLWIRTQVAEDNYNYSSLISSKAIQKVQYSIDERETWVDKKPIGDTIYYRKIRYIPISDEQPNEIRGDAWDVFEGPLELPQGKDGETGTSPHFISFDNDFDVLVRKLDGTLPNKTIVVNIKYFIGDDLQEELGINPKVTTSDNGTKYSVVFPEDSYNSFTITINDASIEEGNITLTWGDITKNFKFKIIDSTEDYDLIVSPQVVNVDELGTTTQQISIQIKDSRANLYSFDNLPEGITISQSFNENKWNKITKNPSFPSSYSKMGIRLFYNNVLFDEEWVEAVHNGLSGTSPYTISLDNDFETVVKNNRVDLASKSITVGFMGYKGSEVANEVTYSVSKGNGGSYGLSLNNTEKKFTISNLNSCVLNTTYSVNVIAKLGENIVASKIFKFQVIEMDKEYKLKVTPQVLNISNGNTHNISIQVQSGTTIYHKSSDANGEIRIGVEQKDSTNITTLTDWSTSQSLNLNDHKPKIILQWKAPDSDWQTIDYEEITTVANGSDATANLTSTSLVYFDAGQSSSSQIGDATTIWTNVSTAITNIRNKVINSKADTIGYVGIATKSIYNNDNNNPKYTNYSYETYLSFIRNHDTGLVIDTSQSSIYGVQNAFISKLLGTDFIQSSNYEENTSKKATAGTLINLTNGVIKSKNFNIDSSGNVIMAGTITATGGSIGGWKITGTYFYHPSEYTGSGSNKTLTKWGVGFLTGSNVENSSANNPAFYAGYDITKNDKGDNTPYPSGVDSWRSHTAVAITHNGRVLLGCNSSNQAIFDFNPNRATQLIIRGSAEITGTLKAGSIISAGSYNEPMVLGSVYLRSPYKGISSLVTENISVIPGENANKSYGYMSFSTDLISLNMIQSGKDVNNIQTLKIQMWNDSSGKYRGELYGTWKLNGADISTGSDKNIKNSIENLPTQYLNLIYCLNPVRYKYNDGTSDRYHTGFIAQEVENALSICNIDTQDFAALVGFDRGTENEAWGLRYSEFIALNTAAIQTQKKEINELRQQLAEIKEKLK